MVYSEGPPCDDDRSLRDRIRFGPAGWSYADWNGPIFGGSGARGLELVASVFDVVEVNSSFYRLPSSRMASGWVRKVAHNPTFLFTIKLWRGFTHERSFRSADAAEFRDGIEPLAESGRLGAILVQFPWSFRYGDASMEHLERLADVFAGLPLAVEQRHASWDRPEYLALLAARGMAFCNIDQPPHRDGLATTGHVTTGDRAYLRLHGRNAADWFRSGAGRDARYDYRYGLDELAPLARTACGLARDARLVYVVTNNHFGGSAVVNALELRHLVTGERPAVPGRWLESFPRLERVARPREARTPRTLDLFPR